MWNLSLSHPLSCDGPKKKKKGQSNMTNILQPTEQTKDSYNQTSEACGVQEQQTSLQCHVKNLLVSGERNQ